MTASRGITDKQRFFISSSGQVVDDASDGHQDDIWDVLVEPLKDLMERFPSKRLKEGSLSVPMKRINV